MIAKIAWLGFIVWSMVGALCGQSAPVSAVLSDGNGDFDPWNETRWAHWYKNGRLTRAFELDRSVRLAARAEPWVPSLDQMKASALFVVKKAGIAVDGNGVIIDAGAEPYRGATLAELYQHKRGWTGDKLGLGCGIAFEAPLGEGIAENSLRNITLKGFVKAAWAKRNNTHPLRVEHATFSRNSTGLYLSGAGVLIRENLFSENAVTGSYNGVGSHANRFENNKFRDNNYEQHPSYADIVLDTAYASTISDNDFLPSALSSDYFHVGVSLYRNAGEDGNLREDYPRENQIEGNRIDGYTIGINIGARHGRAGHRHDLAKEGRDYAAENLVAKNKIFHTRIGIKINTSGNMIEGNVFTDVAEPVVLHCVAYNLIGTLVRNQPNTAIFCWTRQADYKALDALFSYQRPLMGVIAPDEKLIQVDNDGSAVIHPPTAGRLIVAPTLAADARLEGMIASGGEPLAFAVGDFYENQPGDELAVIWKKPSTKVNRTHYYNIIFYDSDGVEINRSGRSEVAWGGIVSGKFSNKPGEQVAVFTQTPIDGKYPVYIFRRGFAEPETVLLADNPHKIKALAAGNFQPNDRLDEIAVVFESGPADILYVSPRDATWRESSGNAVRIADIVGGHFASGQSIDQVAAIGAQRDPKTGTYPVYFFAPGDLGPYAHSAVNAAAPWAAIGAGNFDPANGEMEVALASTLAIGQSYPIFYFRPGESVPFKQIAPAVLGAPAREIAGGQPRVKPVWSAYERVGGIDSADVLATWGASIVVLPSTVSAGTVALFWMNTPSEDPGQYYFKLTPIVR